jgi:tetratricopeptide (TPR) repeat protein
MKVKVSLLILLASLGAEAAVQGSDFAIGRAYYAGGEFKKAAAHFEMAVKSNPSDAASYYWVGMSYQALADIAFPFAGKYASRARVCLTRAAELAPERLDYRKELFDFLLDPGSSGSAARQAAAILRRVSPNDPDYDTMRRQFARESKANASADARLGTLFLAVPRAAYRLAELAPVRGAPQ